MIRCPYCLNEVEPKFIHQRSTHLYTCPKEECKHEIPRIWVEGRNIPKTAVGLVGFPGHGKTVYLTSLFYLLKEIGREWTDGYYLNSLDEHTLKMIHNHVEEFKSESRLPQSTPVNFPFPTIIHLRNIPFPHFKDLLLSVYDTAGEVFESSEKIPDHGRFVAHSDVVLFIISVKDSIIARGHNWPSYMEYLLDTYIKAVYDRMHITLKNKQSLVVVLTKADELAEEILSKRLSDCLGNGSYKQYLDLDCVSRVKETTALIRDWLSKKGCNGFIAMAEDKFKSVQYTIVSATGASPVGRSLATQLKPEDPKRVLDPFIWILEKSKSKGWLRKLLGLLGGK